MIRSTAYVLFLACPVVALAQPRLEGVWGMDPTLPSRGWEYAAPSFTAEGRRRAEGYSALTDDPSRRCIPSGLGRAWDEPDTGFEIQQFDDRVVIRYEMFDLIRTIALNQHGHSLNSVPSTANIHGLAMPTMGHSIAWYEGDALVIETLDYAPGYITTLVEISGGIIPQSEAMRSRERIFRDGERIAVEITYVDPIILAEPLAVRYLYRRYPFELTEYGCTVENAAE